MKIGNISKTKEIIDKYDFHIKKKFGQNFLIDENILNNIVLKSGVDSNTGVIEIGPGLGSLTSIICKNAKKVLAYEIDETLIPILNETLKEFNNKTILNQDILKSNVNLDIEKYLSDCDKIFVIANLPYYITTPILFHLLETTPKINKYTCMMQKEVADRICSNPNIKDYNSLSIAIQYRANAKKIINVPKTVFIPAPNVDSAVITLDVYDKLPYKALDEAKFFRLVKSSFAQRRKTLVNNLVNEYHGSKEEYEKLLINLGFDKNIRAEGLSVKDFVKISDNL